MLHCKTFFLTTKSIIYVLICAFFKGLVEFFIDFLTAVGIITYDLYAVVISQKPL